MKAFKKLLCVLLTLTMILPSALVTMFAFGDVNTESTIQSEAPDEYVLYEEDFDDVTGTVTLDAGNNMAGGAQGWIYTKKSENGSVKIENGRMYIEGNLYDVVYRDGGETWGNYTLEADFCYTDENKNWGGMLFNVQSGYKFQKVGITPSNGAATINGYDNGWTNDNKSINHWSMTNNPSLVIPQSGDPFRMKVTVYNKTATFYYAMLNNDGSMKTDFIQLMSISNIPANAQTGSIGFMLPKKETDWGSYWVDNIKCYSDTLVSYSENFDSYGDTALTADAKNATLGVYFEKSNTLASGGAEIKDGALHLSGGGKNFNAVFFECGYNWTNYVVESDFTYVSESNNAGWAGLLFRSKNIDNFWKGSVYPDNTSAQPVLNSQAGGSWYNNTDNKAVYLLGYGETVRMRIVVNEKTATLYAAKYKDGVLGEWTKILTTASEDKFAGVHMQGTVGIIVGGSNDAKEKHIYIDNLTVSRIEGADRMATPPNAADIYEPVSGIVNPPVVVQELTDTLPNAKGERAAVVMTKVDADMNGLKSDGTVLTTVSSFIDSYRDFLIPAFIVDSEAEADALAALVHEKELIDCYVVAEKSNAGLVKRVRLANATTSLISGALIFDDLNTPDARKEARALVTDNMSYVAISRAPLTEESAFYFSLRQVAAWSYASDVAGVYTGIANGYHGIVATDVSYVYDVYESITAVTVSGKPVIIAHRGANKSSSIPYPENTLMGIRAAKEIYGADAAEIDFGLSSDGYAILMHDSTVDRTTNGTGNFSSFTLAKLKALVVDEVAGKETTIPTLEEAIQLALELDIVLYCHVKTVSDANIAVFSYLVDKYNAHENVLLFASKMDSYNSNVDRVVSSTPYGFTSKPVVTDGIMFTAGNQIVLEGLSSHLDGVVAMRNSITKYNYQPLFYQYSKQGALWGDESFYYQLSARGLVNTHSITDGQENMDKTALTGSGAVGYLTNNLQFCDDYHYGFDLSSEKLTRNHGEKINLKKALKMIMGSVELDCGIIQIGGDELLSLDGSYTLNDDGTATVVYYTTRTAEGGSAYRVYSAPVALTFDCIDHVFTDTEKNDTHHWNVCHVCGEIETGSEAEHSFGEWTVNGDTRTRECSCGHIETEPFTVPTPPANNLIFIVVAAIALAAFAAAFIIFFAFRKKRN